MNIKFSIILVAGIVSGCSFYSSEPGSYITTPAKKVDSATRLEVAGADLRIYEFTPETNKNVTCIFVAGSQKSGLFCVPKQPNNANEIVGKINPAMISGGAVQEEKKYIF